MNAPLTTRAGEGYDRRAWTVDELRALAKAGLFDDSEPFELIEGELLAVNAKHNRHEIWKRSLNYLLFDALKRRFAIAVESTLFLDAISAPEPDIMVYPRGILPEDVRPTDVLLLVEVTDSSQARDLVLKAGLYARHRVPHYWVLDAENRRAIVHAVPIEGRYSAVETHEMDAALALPFAEDLSIHLRDLDDY